MASYRSIMNVMFAAITVLLAATALVSLNIDEDRHVHLPAESGPESDPKSDNVAPAVAADRIAALERLAAQNPDNPEYLAQLGNLHYDNGNYARAAEYYRRCLEIRPQDPYVETDLATCYHYSGRPREALQALDHVIQYQPDFLQAHFNKGVVLTEGLKDIKGGIAAWEELLRLAPEYPERATLERRITRLREQLDPPGEAGS